MTQQLSSLVLTFADVSESCLLDRFRCDTGRCAASLHQWGYSDNPLCICGLTLSLCHVINDCPVNKFEGGLATIYTTHRFQF